MTEKKPIITVKVGTSSLTAGEQTLKRHLMVDIVRQIAQLKQQGHSVLLITSGAIAAGRHIINNKVRLNRSLPTKQMLAAIGQLELMQAWRDLFSIWEIAIGQVLLTRADICQRQGYLNIRDTLHTLLAHGVVPIINENDTVATDEIKVGDNDNLAALVANVVCADLLVLLTDQEGLLSGDPRKEQAPQLIPLVECIDASTYALIGAGAGTQGTGGMATKLQAAQLATHSGTTVIIASASRKDVLIQLAAGEKIGTTFIPKITLRESRKRWLLSEKPQGSIAIDAGAAMSLVRSGASVLPAGVKKVASHKAFERGALVEVLDPEASPLAVGLVNYSSKEIELIAGLHSSAITERLGYSYGHEIIHRDNIALLTKQ